MNDVGVWVVMWNYRGHKPYIDFWEQADAYDFAQRLAESPDRMDVQLFQHDIPAPDDATKARIAERIQRQVNADALLREMTA